MKPAVRAALEYARELALIPSVNLKLPLKFMEIKKHLELLGLRVEDRVTGIRGVVASISFDLYGCVQAIVHPGLDKDKKPLECHYYDVSRLKVLYNQARHGSPELRFRTAGGRQTGRMRKAGNVQALNNQ